MCDNWFENFKDAVQESKKLNNTGYLIDKSLTALTYKVLKNIDSWKDDDIYQTVKRDNQKVYYVVGIDGSIGLISNEKDGAGWFLTPPEDSLEWRAVISLLKDDNKRLESQLKDQDEELERAINIINDLNMSLPAIKIRCKKEDFHLFLDAFEKNKEELNDEFNAYYPHEYLEDSNGNIIIAWYGMDISWNDICDNIIKVIEFLKKEKKDFDYIRVGDDWIDELHSSKYQDKWELHHEIKIKHNNDYEEVIPPWEKIKIEITVYSNTDSIEREFTWDSIHEFKWDVQHPEENNAPRDVDEVLCYSFDGIVQNLDNIPNNESGYKDFSSLLRKLNISRQAGGNIIEIMKARDKDKFF